MLIRAFRIRGHLIANLDPLSIQKKKNILSLNQKLMDLLKKIMVERFLRWSSWTPIRNLNQILKILKNLLFTIGYEFMHMGDPDEKAWIKKLKDQKRYFFYREWEKSNFK